MQTNIVLLAGGRGKRLWPLSNYHLPKQFIILPNKKLSSFQLALLRAIKISPSNNIIITTHLSYEQLLWKQIRSLGIFIKKDNVILENSIQNTGLTIYNVCNLFIKQHNDKLTYFLPTDQITTEDHEFFLKAAKKTNTSKINLFGKKEFHACKNFGYLRINNKISHNYYSIQQFIEKPNDEILKQIYNKNIYRNLGIYLAKPSILYQEFHDLNQNLLLLFEQKQSIDKIISEKSKELYMHEVNFMWKDLGSIENLYRFCKNEWFDNSQVDSDEVNKFNNENKEFRLEYNDKFIKIVKL